MEQYSLIINPFAQSDLKFAADWYAERKEGLDREFIEEIEKTIQQIIINPAQFAFVRKKSEWRLLNVFHSEFTTTLVKMLLMSLPFFISAEIRKLCGDE